MFLADLGLLAADTARSRAYVQALAQHRLLPVHALIMRAAAGGSLPGQLAMSVTGVSARVEFLGLEFDPGQPVVDTLRDARVPHTYVDSTDVNSKAVLEALWTRPETVFIYSGFGGQILRDAVLGSGKRFLHVHGGYVPDFRGSTTNYYSLLRTGECGASAIFLTRELDAGPVLLRRRFAPPPDRSKIDYVYDSLYRARVLVDVAAAYESSGRWPDDSGATGEGETYFVMHPVLRHIAILSS